MTTEGLTRMPSTVVIREVGPRDGLQPESPVPVEERISLIELLIGAGLRRIEVAAFVSPKAVPAMAGAAEVLAGVPARPGLVRAALVPNTRGAVLALEAGVDEITVTISASPTYNERNVRMTIAESQERTAEIVVLATTAGVPVDVVVSCAFGSPYEAEIDPAEVASLVGRLAAFGVEHVTLADTTGVATPRRVNEVLDALEAVDGGLLDLGLHLHDTRGTALVNAYAALQRGIDRFDTAVGGLGGSPFAAGAGGNLATESLVALLDDLEIETGVAVEGLIDAAGRISELVDRPVLTGIARHGPRNWQASGD